jgi:hypothetical protein
LRFSLELSSEPKMKATRALQSRADFGNNNDDERDSQSVGSDDMNDINEGLQMIADSVIGEDYLRRVANQNDLSKVEYLAMQVDMNVQSILGVEDLLPSLTSLVLDESIISSVRDLGTGFKNLISLSINTCALSDLDGISALANLKDLSASDNFITDCASLTMHEHIETLKLSGNNIVSISVADELNSCPMLKSLFLSRNPVEKSPKYRLVISSLITGLEKLDGVPVDRGAASKVTNSMLLEAADALKLAEEEADDEERLMMDMQLDLEAEIAGAGGAPMRVSNPTPVSSSSGRPGSGGGSDSLSPRGGMVPDTGSELTHGSTVVLAGGMAAAMRRRNRPGSGGGGRGGHAGGSNEDLTMMSDVDRASSTLDVLDCALRQQGSSQHHRPRPLGTQYEGEGDVTHVLHPEHADSPRMLRMSKQQQGGGVTASFDPEGSYDEGLGVEEMVLERGHSNRSSRDYSSGRPGGDNVNGNGGSKNQPPQARGGQWVTGGSNKSPDRSRANAKNTPSAVFKIAADENDLAKFKSKISTNDGGEGDSNSSGTSNTNTSANNVNKKGRVPVWDVARTSTGHRAERVVEPAARGVAGLGLLGDDNTHNDASATTTNNNFGGRGAREEEEEEEYHGHQDGSADRSDKALAVERARFGPKSSYIHRDMVIRSNEDDHDDEGIAVSALARQQLAGANRVSRAAAGGGTGAADDTITTGGTSTAADPSASAAAGVFPSKGAASMAGMSLGFNLKESLAAIDQWVEEMDSDDESTSRDGLDDDDDSADEDEIDIMALSHKSLITSYADVTPEKTSMGDGGAGPSGGMYRDSHINSTPGEVGGGAVHGSSSSSNNRPGSKGSSRSGSRGSSRADSFAPENAQGGSQQRILSRDVIISMCHGGERLSEATSSENLEAQGGGDKNPLEVVDSPPSAATALYVPSQHVPTYAKLPSKESAAAVSQQQQQQPLSGPKSPSSSSSSGASPSSLLRVEEVRVNSNPDPNSSPPRVEDSIAPCGAATSSSSGSGGHDDRSQQAGPAVGMSDLEIITMLRMKPKAVPALRTKSAYCNFFTGISRARMVCLLEKAHEDLPQEEKQQKVDKRIAMLDGYVS